MGNLQRLVGLAIALGLPTGAAAKGATLLSASLAGRPTPASATAEARYLGDGWWNDGGLIYRSPHYMLTLQLATALPALPPKHLRYHGGPVLRNPHLYLIFWGYGTVGDPDAVAPLLISYAGDIGGSAYADIVTQYHGHSRRHITNPSHQLAGWWFDERAIPVQPSARAVAAEAVRGMNHFGGYDPEGSYVVATAHDHNSLGFGVLYCAYHAVTVSNGKVLSYTNLPYVPDARKDCGADFIPPPSDESSKDEGVTIVEGHEYAESITDPQLPSGWSDPNWGEIGDMCEWKDVRNDSYGLQTYTAQPLWSNAADACVHRYP